MSSVQLPALAGEYGVLGTPHIVIAHRKDGLSSEPEHLRGQVSETRLLEAILKAT